MTLILSQDEEMSFIACNCDYRCFFFYHSKQFNCFVMGKVRDSKI
jgi:hypothetical protein